MYDTTTGGLNNAGLAEGSGQNREDVERTRDALDDVRTTEPGMTEPGMTEPGMTEPGTTEPGTARRIGRSARRPAPIVAAALLLAGAAATAVLLRRRAAAKRQAGWNRVLPGFLKR
jgi:hypothetical protein